MRIELQKFGDMLISRPAGREAFLSLSAYITRGLDTKEPVEIDFSGVKVLTPSWADEVITKIAKQFPNTQLINTTNSSVQATLKTLRKYSELAL